MHTIKLATRKRPTANRKWTKNFASHLSNFLYTFCVMWGQTYTRHRRARDVRRAAERAAARNGDAIDAASEAAIDVRMQGRNATRG
jgi:hypothetical protein